MSRPINVIAREVCATWNRPHFAAIPYLRAMLQLETIDDAYGADDARGILLYFLSNARTWRGDDARRLKAELRAILVRR